jgi:hypothetical protein
VIVHFVDIGGIVDHFVDIYLAFQFFGFEHT